MRRLTLHSLLILTVFVGLLSPAGCQTGGQTGALAGGGIGALAGQVIGGDTTATLIGAAVGTGVGYIIGNEQDKKHAAEMSRPPSSPSAPTHGETGSLGGTRWIVVSLNPRNIVPAYTSKIVDFQSNGRVVTTTTRPDGTVDVADETYRVVGDTLIVNKPGYLINARYSVSGGQLTVSADDFSAVLQRL